jgi:hypothetical protein
MFFHFPTLDGFAKTREIFLFAVPRLNRACPLSDNSLFIEGEGWTELLRIRHFLQFKIHAKSFLPTDNLEGIESLILCIFLKPSRRGSDVNSACVIPEVTSVEQGGSTAQQKAWSKEQRTALSQEGR